MARIYSQNERHSTLNGVEFYDGIAFVHDDEKAILNYFTRRGYEVVLGNNDPLSDMEKMTREQLADVLVEFGNVFEFESVTKRELLIMAEATTEVYMGEAILTMQAENLAMSEDIDEFKGDVNDTLSAFAQTILEVEHLSEAIINVMNHGAVGDGVADDSVAIQSAVDEAKLVDGTVLFPFGKTFICENVNIYEGITLSGYGATLKAPAMQGHWKNILTTAIDKYSADVDSKPLTIKGLTFDGNRANQGAYNQFELQQNMQVMLTADNTKAGKLKAFVSDCHFNESVSDGVHAWVNVDLTVTDCDSWDCFRGGVTITGGHSKVKVNNFSAGGNVHNSGIDVEVDANGFGSTKKVEIVMNNLNLQGDFDVGVADGSKVFISNCISHNPPFSIFAENSQIKIINSKFVVAMNDAPMGILFPHDVTFINCDFVVRKDDAPASQNHGLMVYMATASGSPHNQRLRFDNCSFSSEGLGVEEYTSAIACAYWNPAINKNLMTVSNSRIDSSINIFVDVASGGNFAFDNLECDATTFVRLQNASVGLTYRLSGFLKGDFEKYLHFSSILVSADKIIHDNVVFEAEQNVIGVDNGVTYWNASVLGNRIIYGDVAPTGQSGFANDIYRLNTPVSGQPYEWQVLEGDWTVTKTL